MRPPGPGRLLALVHRYRCSCRRAAVAGPCPGDPGAASRIRYLLHDLDGRVQLAAIETTGILRNHDALPDLIDVLNRANAQKTRRAALTASSWGGLVSPLRALFVVCQRPGGRWLRPAMLR